MKSLAALFLCLACATAVVAETKPAAKPAAPAAAAAKPAEEPKIPGIVIDRSSGNLLGLALEGGTFKLSFYDKKTKKPMNVDVSRATARWDPKYKVGSEFVVMNLLPGGKALGGGKPVRGPYAFKLYLTLLQGDGDNAKAVENYVVDFHL